MTREYTNKMLNMVDEGLFGNMNESAKQLVWQLLMWMPERDVEDFYCANYSDLEQLEEEECNIKTFNLWVYLANDIGDQYFTGISRVAVERYLHHYRTKYPISFVRYSIAND